MYKELREVWDEMTAPGQMFEINETEVRGCTLKSWALAPGSVRDVTTDTRLPRLTSPRQR